MSEQPDIFSFVVLIFFVCLSFFVGQKVGKQFGNESGWRFLRSVVGGAFAGAVFLSVFSFLWLGEDNPIAPYSMLGNGIATGLGLLMRRANEDPEV